MKKSKEIQQPEHSESNSFLEGNKLKYTDQLEESFNHGAVSQRYALNWFIDFENLYRERLEKFLVNELKVDKKSPEDFSAILSYENFRPSKITDEYRVMELIKGLQCFQKIRKEIRIKGAYDLSILKKILRLHAYDLIDENIMSIELHNVLSNIPFDVISELQDQGYLETFMLYLIPSEEVESQKNISKYMQDIKLITLGA